jgi:acetyl esterase/lipase
MYRGIISFFYKLQNKYESAMKKYSAAFIVTMCLLSTIAFSQPDFIKETFPKGTVFHQNIPYAADTLKKHLLDIYIPAKMKDNAPLLVWVHGGAWMANDKYADMGYMTGLLKSLMENGYALASIDYRHSTQKIFPAQIQDCNRAIEFLYNNATQYKFNKEKIILIGFSAGGHLASLAGLSNNQTVPEFYHDGKRSAFKIKAVIDFYGPSQFLMFFGMAKPGASAHDPISTLLGNSPVVRPDLSDLASPVTYVDKNDPPFFIVHGEKDEDVPVAQSILLQSYLNIVGVKNDLTIVKDAPHYGVMFDTEAVRKKILNFIEEISK